MTFWEDCLVSALSRQATRFDDQQNRDDDELCSLWILGDSRSISLEDRVFHLLDEVELDHLVHRDLPNYFVS